MISINYDHLQLLYDFMSKHVEDADFTMKMFRGLKEKDSNREVEIDNVTTDECGNIGCMLGWAICVKGLEPKESDLYEDRSKGIDFQKYKERVFGIFSSDNKAREVVQTHWLDCYLFSYHWVKYKPTKRDAMIRLKNVIDKEVTPENVRNYLPWYNYVHGEKYGYVDSLEF